MNVGIKWTSFPSKREVINIRQYADHPEIFHRAALAAFLKVILKTSLSVRLNAWIDENINGHLWWTFSKSSNCFVKCSRVSWLNIRKHSNFNEWALPEKNDLVKRSYFSICYLNLLFLPFRISRKVLRLLLEIKAAVNNQKRWLIKLSHLWEAANGRRSGTLGKKFEWHRRIW